MHSYSMELSNLSPNLIPPIYKSINHSPKNQTNQHSNNKLIMKIITNLRGQTSLIQHTSGMYIYRSFHIHANRSIHVFSDYPSFIQNIVYHLAPNKISRYHHYTIKVSLCSFRKSYFEVTEVENGMIRTHEDISQNPVWTFSSIDKMNCMPHAFINACTLKGIQPPTAIMQMQASECLVSTQLLAYMHLCCVADQVQPNKPCRE